MVNDEKRKDKSASVVGLRNELILTSLAWVAGLRLQAKVQPRKRQVRVAHHGDFSDRVHVVVEARNPSASQTGEIDLDVVLECHHYKVLERVLI